MLKYHKNPLKIDIKLIILCEILITGSCCSQVLNLFFSLFFLYFQRRFGWLPPIIFLVLSEWFNNNRRQDRPHCFNLSIFSPKCLASRNGIIFSRCLSIVSYGFLFFKLILLRKFTVSYYCIIFHLFRKSISHYRFPIS